MSAPSELMLKIWLFAAVLVPLLRLLRLMIQRHYRRKYHTAAPALIIGSGPIAHQLITRMRQVADYGLNPPVGVLDDVRPADAELLDVPYLGTPPDNIDIAARATRAEELIVTPDVGARRAVDAGRPSGPEPRDSGPGGTPTDGRRQRRHLGRAPRRHTADGALPHRPPKAGTSRSSMRRTGCSPGWDCWPSPRSS